MLTSCSGEGPPKTTASGGGVGRARRSRVVVGKIVLVEHDVARTQVVPDPGHGLVAPGHDHAAQRWRRRRRRRARRREDPHRREWCRGPLRGRRPAGRGGSSGPPRPGRRPRRPRPGRRRRSPRPVAARARPSPASPPPGGPTAGPWSRRAWRAAPRTGRVGVVGVVEDDDTAGVGTGLQPVGRRGQASARRRPIASTGTPSSRATATAARHVARARPGGGTRPPRRRRRRPRRVPSPSSDRRQTSAGSRRDAPTPAGRAGPGASAPVGQGGQAGIVDVQDDGRGRRRGSRPWPSTMRSSEPKRSRWTGPMAVITAMSGTSQEQSSAISPGP